MPKRFVELLYDMSMNYISVRISFVRSSVFSLLVHRRIWRCIQWNQFVDTDIVYIHKSGMYMDVHWFIYYKIRKLTDGSSSYRDSKTIILDKLFVLSVFHVDYAYRTSCCCRGALLTQFSIKSGYYQILNKSTASSNSLPISNYIEMSTRKLRSVCCVYCVVFGLSVTWHTDPMFVKSSEIGKAHPNIYTKINVNKYTGRLYGTSLCLMLSSNNFQFCGWVYMKVSQC